MRRAESLWSAVVCGTLLLAGCGASSSEPTAKVEVAPAALPRVADHTAVFPQRGLTGSRVVPDHILGVQKLPGGSLGEYTVKGKNYQLFIVDAETNQKAAFLLLDLKATLQNPEYIAYIGGYAGSDGAREIYTFAKKQYLAGVVGLPKAAADPIAIELASHLN